jgi:hypothetical protein
MMNLLVIMVKKEEESKETPAEESARVYFRFYEIPKTYF